jgi:hypothetical protein
LLTDVLVDIARKHTMPEPITVTVASGIAAKKIIEKLVEDSYAFVKATVGLQVKKWQAADHAGSVYKRVKQLRLVKTIWQMEKEVDLTTFYYPAKVKIGDKRIAVRLIEDFGCDGSILVEGTVGQGKSIFLRYLASMDVFASRRIPVFVELRRLRQGQSLLAMALQELSALGFEMSEEVFHHFAGSGRLLLLMDAFDEVKEELRVDLIAEMEVLLRRHERLRAVVTSRPDSGIATSPLLRVFRLCALEGKEYEDIVVKMSHDSKTATAIINGIRKEAAQISHVLDTPLMVALLIVRYRIDQSLPENESSFYGALFILLLQRHDKAKGGYVRPRKSGLTDSELSDFFNAMCFITRKAKETSFSRKQSTAYSREALSLLGKKGDPDKVLSDIIEITCLILADGDECKFIHKNVQEYHAALFIRDQPDDAAIAFYVAMDSRWPEWPQEMWFLETMDRYRYLRYFHLPQLRKLLKLEGPLPENWIPPAGILVEIFGQDLLRLGEDDGGGSITFFSTGKFWPTSRLMVREGLYDYARALLRMRRGDFVQQVEKPIAPDSEYRVHELLQMENVGSKVRSCCMKLIDLMIDDLRDSEKFIQQIEGRKKALQF